MSLTEPEATQHLQLQLLWAKHHLFNTHQQPKMLSWRFENIRGRLFKQNLAVVKQNRDLNYPGFSWIFYVNIHICEQFEESWRITV